LIFSFNMSFIACSSGSTRFFKVVLSVGIY
jgi:hypothetical protein